MFSNFLFCSKCVHYFFFDRRFLILFYSSVARQQQKATRRSVENQTKQYFVCDLVSTESASPQFTNENSFLSYSHEKTFSLITFFACMKKFSIFTFFFFDFHTAKIFSVVKAMPAYSHSDVFIIIMIGRSSSVYRG